VLFRGLLVAASLAVAGCTGSGGTSPASDLEPQHDGGTSPGSDASIPVDAPSAPAADGGFDAAAPGPVLLASLMAHNTSASATYDSAHFGANFGSTSWVSQDGGTIQIDPSKEDMSENPVTPAHVSQVDVHRLIPSRPDLRWFAHVTPWFRKGGGSHIDIGLENASAAYVASMIEDMKRRGFDGVIVDWYGKGSYEDSVTLLIQKYLAAIHDNHFTFVVMMDKGIPSLSEAVLETQIRYCQSQYFGDPNYELEAAMPIVMFFGVDAALQTASMSQAKSATGGKMVWVAENAGTLAEPWNDQSFDWTHDYHTGVPAGDPYALGAVKSFYATVARSPKKAFGSMVAGFNGTLTKSVAWSKGKYLPRGSGACLVEWAKTIDAVIPANVTRMQWATWSDWEEGTEIEGGVENDANVVASAQAGILSWTTTTGTGDESTLDHYDVYASSDAVHATLLGSAAAGTHAMPLGSVGLAPGVATTLYVKAVARPNIRDHMSVGIPYRP
jgi:hypothetical protein